MIEIAVNIVCACNRFIKYNIRNESINPWYLFTYLDSINIID